MGNNSCIEKLESLLNDDNACEKTNEWTINTETHKFNKTLKKLLKNENKSCTN